MKLCLHARAINLEIHVEMAKELLKSAIECIFVTQNAKETSYVRNHISDAVIYEMDSYMDEKLKQMPLSLERVTREYPEQNIWRMLYTDRFLVNRNIQDNIRFANAHFCFYEEIFEKEKPDYFFDEAVATFSTYVAYVVGKKLGCRFLAWNLARKDKSFYFFNDIFQRNFKMQKSYQKNEFTLEEKKQAEEYWKEFLEKQKIPDYTRRVKKNRFHISYIAAYVWCCLKNIRKLFSSNGNYYMNYSFRHDLRNTKLVRWYKWKKSEKYFDEVDDSDKYYLFTLHKQPEATTLVCAEKYEKQLFAIDNLAKSIPNGTVLYVKEHLMSQGERDVQFYKTIKSYPNVKLIKPEENIHEVIKKSQAVIVLTASTGFEALLYKKKVFLLGNMYYEYAKGVQKIDDIYAEANKFKEIDSKLTDEDVLQFLCSYLKELHEGYIDVRYHDCAVSDNIELLLKAFREEVEC